MIGPDDLNRLPPALRQQLRSKLLELLAEIGVQPLVDKRTGALHVPLDKMCAALGLSEAEAREMLGDAPGTLITASPDDLEALQ